MLVPPLPDLTMLSPAQKDALLVVLWEQVVALTARLEARERKLDEPPKTSGDSNLPPSKGHKPNRSDTSKTAGPRKGSLAAPATCDSARDIQNRMRRARDQLLTFASFPGRVEAHNDACERDLRPAVIP